MKTREYENVPWQDVESSNIRRVAWVQAGSEAELGTLWVEFHSGKAYRYEQFERGQFDKLLAAESIGRWFNAFVKSRPDIYPVFKVEREAD